MPFLFCAVWLCYSVSIPALHRPYLVSFRWKCLHPSFLALSSPLNSSLHSLCWVMRGGKAKIVFIFFFIMYPFHYVYLLVHTITCASISVALSNLTSGKSKPSRSLSPISSSITTTSELAPLALKFIHFISWGYACCYCCMQLSLVCIHEMFVVVWTLNSALYLYGHFIISCSLSTTQVITLFL